MADFPKNIRRASESHAFQQVLRRNPSLARRADRDRDVVALTFDRAQRLGINNVAILETVFRGYRPEQLYTEPYEQPPPVIVPEDPGVFNATCNDTLIFELAAGEEDVPEEFNFGATTGNAMSVAIDLSAYTTGVDLTVQIDTLSDDCMLFLLEDGYEQYDTDPDHYTADPGETLGPTTQTWTIPASTLDAYEGRVFHVVIFHKSTLPLVNGVLRVYCTLPAVAVTAVTPSGIVHPGIITTTPTTVRLTGVSLLNTQSVAVEDVTGISPPSSIDSFTPVDFNTLDVAVVTPQTGRKSLTVTCDDPPGVSNAVLLLVAVFTTTPVERGAQIQVSLGVTSLGDPDDSLTSTSSVLIDGVSTTFDFDGGDPNILLIDVPANAPVGLVDITITTSAGTFLFQDAATILGTPYISSVSPVAVVATTGSFFLDVAGDHLSGITTALVDGNSFTVSVIDDTQAQIFVSDGSVLSPGTTNVTVNDPATGTSNVVTFEILSAINITSLSKNAIPQAGDTITIFGNGFENVDDVSEVTFGAQPVSALTPVDANEIEVDTGAFSSTAILPLTITSEDGSSAPTNVLVYSLSPTTQAEGGIISIQGIPGSVDGVTVDGAAASFDDSGTDLDITIPSAITIGVVDIAITVGSDVFLIVGELTVTAGGASPVVESTRFGVSDTAGGTSPDGVFGTNFVNGATVKFYTPGTSTLVGTATGVVWKSSTYIEFIAPAMPAGLYDLRVTNPDAQFDTLSNGYEAWSPDEELTTLGEGVFLPPGGYDASTGTWTGTHYNATAGDVTQKPSAYAGMPIISGTAGEYLVLNASFAGNLYGNTLANADEGSIVVGYAPFRERISGVRPTADGAFYYNSSIICGVAASPGLAHSTEGFKAVSYDGVDYQISYAGKALDCRHHVGATTWDATSQKLRAKVDGSGWTEKALAAGGIDGGGGSNIGATTEIGRSYAGTEYFRGLITFVFACPQKLADATVDKFKKWAHTSGLYDFHPLKTGPTRYYLSGGFSTVGTVEEWNAPTDAVWPDLTPSGSSGPSDNGSGEPVFSGLESLEDGIALSVWSNAEERHFYAKVTTYQITTTNHTTNIYDNHSPVRDNNGYTGLALAKDGTVFYALMFDRDLGAVEHHVRVDISHLVDATGAGTFTIQGKKVAGRLYVRVNNEPWQMGADAAITATGSTVGVYTVGYLMDGVVHENGHWAHELPNALSNALAIYGGATDEDAYARWLPGLRMWNRVEDADTTVPATALEVLKMPDISDHGDPCRNLLAAGVGGPYITQDATANDRWRMGSVAEGQRRVQSNDRPSGAAQVSPFELPSELFAFASAQPFTVYLVLDNDGASTVYWMLNKDGSGADASNLFGTGGSVSLGVQSGGSASLGTGKRVVCIIFDGASTKMYDNDYLNPVATVSGGTGTATSLSMGTYEDTPTWGEYERIEYDGAHTDAERQEIMWTLGTKYNITVL